MQGQIRTCRPRHAHYSQPFAPAAGEIAPGDRGKGNHAHRQRNAPTAQIEKHGFNLNKTAEAIGLVRSELSRKVKDLGGGNIKGLP
jgi:hypothetical protein